MTEHDKVSSDVEATASSEQVVAPSQGRRQFVKGAIVATPAVMAVVSGRLAFAQNSSPTGTSSSGGASACASCNSNG